MQSSIVAHDSGPLTADPKRLRILLVAPPVLPIPPPTYAGTERVVAALGDELHRRGHEVALVAAGDSNVPYRLIPSLEGSLWSTGYAGALDAYLQHTVAVAWREAAGFDVVHAHLEGHGFLLARYGPVPVVSTLHGRLDAPGLPELLAEHRSAPLVAISRSQRRFFPSQRWVATIHHGLPLSGMPFSGQPGDYLAFVGRATPEKGLAEALQLSRRAGVPLRVAAKVHLPAEHRHFEQVAQPAIETGEIESLGEIEAAERDALLAGALATIMLGGWPEPFGLVAIESMATGTPVIARRAGALTETVEHGVTGFLVDDIAEAELALAQVRGLDRGRVRERALQRFSPQRMAGEYEHVYRQLVAERTQAPRASRP